MLERVDVECHAPAGFPVAEFRSQKSGPFRAQARIGLAQPRGEFFLIGVGSVANPPAQYGEPSRYVLL